MAYPSYRRAVLRVDGLFRDMAGWSVIEKAITLDSPELNQTIHAQPVTFMIQVGIVHLLQDVGVVPSMVSHCSYN